MQDKPLLYFSAEEIAEIASGVPAFLRGTVRYALTRRATTLVQRYNSEQQQDYHHAQQLAPTAGVTVRLEGDGQFYVRRPDLPSTPQGRLGIVPNFVTRVRTPREAVIYLQGVIEGLLRWRNAVAPSHGILPPRPSPPPLPVPPSATAVSWRSILDSRSK